MSDGRTHPGNLERHKIRAAEWLYRWQLSSGIVGIMFTILTFLGVATLVLGPALNRMGLSYLETGFIVLAFVVVMIVGFGVFLDRTVKFWSAQATVGTVRNPYLVDVLYQKELLALVYVHRPLLQSLRILLDEDGAGGMNRKAAAAELDRALERIERTIRDKRWPVEPEERVY